MELRPGRLGAIFADLKADDQQTFATRRLKVGA